MAQTRVAIRHCPGSGCFGWLVAPHRAMTMRCACDNFWCRKEFLVSLAFGIVEPWESAPAWHRKIANDALVSITEWQRRFEEAEKAAEEKRLLVEKHAKEKIEEAKWLADKKRREEEQRRQASTQSLEQKKRAFDKARGKIVPMRPAV